MTADDWKKLAEAESAVMASIKQVYSECVSRRPGGEKHPTIVAYETAQARFAVFNTLANSAESLPLVYRRSLRHDTGSGELVGISEH